jgi:hypothetical protein
MNNQLTNEEKQYEWRLPYPEEILELYDSNKYKNINITTNEEAIKNYLNSPEYAYSRNFVFNTYYSLVSRFYKKYWTYNENAFSHISDDKVFNFYNREFETKEKDSKYLVRYVRDTKDGKLEWKEEDEPEEITWYKANRYSKKAERDRRFNESLK